MGAGMTFWSDEWAFIQTRALGDPVSWLPPHNEHWSTVPIVIYRLLVETVGLGSYMPYLAVLVALHVTIAGLVYILVRQAAGAWAGLGAGVIVLLLGSGFENIFWAFQIGFLGSVAAGLGALAAFDRPSRGWIAVGALLVVVSLASSGIGLVMAAVVAIDLLFDRQRRVLLATLNAPAALYALWYVTFGRLGLSGQRNPMTLEAVRDVPSFVADGLQGAAGALSGLGAGFGIVVIVLALAITVWRLWRSGLRGIPPRFVACLVGVVAMYALIGLVRAQLFATVGQYTRYTYIAVVLLLVALAALIGRIQVPERRLGRLAVVAGAASLFAISLSWNVHLLVSGRELFQNHAMLTRALIVGATDPSRPPTVDPQGIIGTETARYGSPLSDALVPWAVRPIPPDYQAEINRQLASGEVTPPVVP